MARGKLEKRLFAMSHNDSLKKIREEKEKWEEKTLKPASSGSN